MCGKGSQSGGGTGALGWGGLAPSQQQTVQASPQALGWYNQAMGLAQQAVSKPYQQFGTQASDFVAQLNAQQQAAQQGIQQQAAATSPYAQMAPQMAAQAGMGNAAQLAATQYMNPYMSQVVNPVQQALQQQQAQQLSQQQTDAIKAGAFGGSRSDVARALLQGQQQLGMGQALSPLYQTGYGQALGAAQTDLARQLQAAQGLQGSGLTAQQASLGAGTLGQQTQQAGISALQQQFNQQQMWPYMQAQFLSGIAGGLGPLTGQQTYQAAPMSPFGSFLGFADGGSVDGDDAARMGGAVIDATPGQDYYAGGIAPAGYAKGGVSYAGGDIGDILKSEAETLREDPEAYAKLPSGQIQAAHGLQSANLAQPQQKKTGLSDIISAGKEALGLGKDVYDVGKGAYDWWNKPSSGVSGAAAADELAKSGGALGGLADTASGSGFLSGLGDAVSSGLGWLGDAAMALAPVGLADGGRVGYDDGGPIDDIFNRGIIGAESAGRQFDRYGRTLTSPKGAEGISQIMPGTAPEAAKLAGLPYDPARVRSDEAYNKALGRAYYNEQLRKFGTPELAAAAYNAGPGRLQSALRQAQATGRDVMSFLPAETQAYVPKVMGRGVTAPGGGLDQARAELLASRRAIPMGDPRRRMMALDQSSGVVPASSTPPSTSGVSTGAAKEGGLGGLLTEQNVIPALMGIGKGISGMMSAKTVSPGAAIAAGLGEGLAGGAESYLGTQKTLADVENIKQQAAERAELAKRAAAETRTEGARTGQVEALTKQIGAGTEKTYAEIAGNSVKEVNGITYIQYIDPKTGAYRMMNIGEWNTLDPSERPSIDPRLVSIAQEVEAKKLASGAPSGGGAPAVGGAPRAPSGAMPEAPKVAPTSTTSVPEEVGKYAQSVAISKSGLSREGRAQVPDLFSPQIELARNSEEQKNNLLPLIGALAALPPKQSVLTSGRQQEILNPLVGYLAGIARTFGQEEFVLSKLQANPEMLADTEEVKKLVNQMQQTATQNNQLHAFGAFKELAEGIPSLLNSPGAQRRLAAQLLTANQRQIDKNNVFTDWRRQAAGPRGANAEFARLTSPEANKFFDDTYSNAFYAPDREKISSLFTIPVPVKGGGTRSLAEVLSRYPNKLTPEYKEYLNKQYPGVLRYFGIR